MLFSYNWLKEYVAELPCAKELARMLTMTGTEVESVAEAGVNLSNVVAAEVLSVGPHPNADRLSLCEVRTDGQTHSIVCGAKNMKAGDRVALALPGAELPGGVKIKKSKIRGVESGGMMCSESELGLKEKSEGIMILPEDTPLGRDITSVLGLKDYMMEVGVTPNRADLLGVKGLAREISAVTGAKVSEKEFQVPEDGGPIGELIKVSIDEGAPCSRYAARAVTGVKIGPSPAHISSRLEAHGIRAVNNVVDATNYVMLELGQPLHAFDLGKIQGKTIRVRLAGRDEELETIDNKKRRLDGSALVIADASAPVALAGVMGGKGSEVSDSTVDILLESAWFDPGAVRRASRKAGLSSDSSYRFERGVDIENVVRALDMAAAMILKYAGGKAAKGRVDIYRKRFKPAEIEFRVKRAEEVLGITVKEDRVLDIFKRLGIGLKWTSDGVLTALAPSFRMDLKIETDLIEEVARLFGYDNIPTTLPTARLVPGTPARRTQIGRKLREILTNQGFLEVINYSFVSGELFNLVGPKDKKGVAVLNPITEEQSVMRDSLLPSLFETLRRNIQRKNEEVRVFELAPGFIPEAELPIEKWMVSGLMYGMRWEESWNYPKQWLDFFDVKGVVESILDGLGLPDGLKLERAGGEFTHPGKSAAIMLQGRPAGIFGEIHPDLMSRFDLKRPAYLFEIELDALLEAAGGLRKYAPLPRFPESTRDIAFIVDENIAYGEIIRTIERIDTKLIERVELFDVYYGGNIPPGKRSMALRIVYRSMERTLTYQEVEDIHSKVGQELSSNFGAEIRA